MLNHSAFEALFLFLEKCAKRLTQKSPLYAFRIRPVRQQFSNANLSIQGCTVSVSGSQVNSSFPLNSFLFCSVVSFIMLDSWLHYFCSAFFYQQKSLHLNETLVFFFFPPLNKFSHRINDRRRLIVCFQYWLFSSPASIFEANFIFRCPGWDDTKLERLVQILLTCISDYKGCPPLICHLQGRQRPGARETTPDVVQERIRPDALCFVGCFFK